MAIALARQTDSGVSSAPSLSNTAQPLIVVMALHFGGALIPLTQGAVAGHIGLQRSFVIVAIAYIYITFYGVVGNRRRPVAAAPVPPLAA